MAVKLHPLSRGKGRCYLSPEPKGQELIQEEALYRWISKSVRVGGGGWGGLTGF